MEHLAKLGFSNPGLRPGAAKRFGNTPHVVDMCFNRLWMGVAPYGIVGFDREGARCRLCGKAVHRRRVVHHVLFHCVHTQPGFLRKIVSRAASRIVEENLSKERPQKVPQWGEIDILRVLPEGVMEAIHAFSESAWFSTLR